MNLHDILSLIVIAANMVTLIMCAHVLGSIKQMRVWAGLIEARLNINEERLKGLECWFVQIKEGPNN